jgi:hypothetical protein
MMAPPPLHEPQPQMSMTPGGTLTICNHTLPVCGSAALPPCRACAFAGAAAIEAQPLFFGAM